MTVTLVFNSSPSRLSTVNVISVPALTISGDTPSKIGVMAAEKVYFGASTLLDPPSMPLVTIRTAELVASTGYGISK
jgi:hypothetical protein